MLDNQNPVRMINWIGPEKVDKKEFKSAIKWKKKSRIKVD